MIRRSLLESLLLAFFAIVAGCSCPLRLPRWRTERIVGPPRHPRIAVDLQDTGKTIALPMGVELVVTLPLKTYNDNYWYIYRNSGVPLKLIAGPNEMRGRNFKPWTRQAAQVFYFRKESPGTTHLVLEQSYWSKPMILKVVDGPPASAVLRLRLHRQLRHPPRAWCSAVSISISTSRTIRPGDAAVLDEDVAKLKANPNVSVNVNGYCDAIGS